MKIKDNGGMYVSEFRDNVDVANEYGESEQEKIDILNTLNTSKIYIAWYGYGDYSGDSYVLYEREGKLYEVDASHCSCYGLKGQWKPLHTEWKAVNMREFYDSYDQSELVKDFIKKLCEEKIKEQL